MKNLLLKIWSFVWRLLVVGASSFIVLSIGYILLVLLAGTGFLGMSYSWSLFGGTYANFKGLDYVLYLLIICFGFMISRLLHKKNLKDTLRFWFKIIVIGVIIFLLYLLSWFVEDKYRDYYYNRQVTNFKNSAEIVFELNRNKVYVDIDNMKAYKVKEPYTSREYKIEYSTLEECVEKSLNHDGIIELYNKDNKIVYGVKHYGDFDFIFIIINENEYLMINNDGYLD